MVDTPNGSFATISENDDGVRNLKASESVVAAFHAEGFPSPPAGIADIIATHVKSSTRDIPLSKIANMAPGSGSLGTSAAAGVNMFLNMLTPAQREAAKAGVNPLDPAAVLKFSAMMNHQLGASGASLVKGDGGSLSSRGGNQFAELRAGTSGSDSATYSALASEGFSKAQITSAVNFSRELGLNGTSYARDIANSSNDEKDLYRAYKSAKTEEDRKAIQGKLDALPTKKGEAEETAKKRRHHVIDGIDELHKRDASNDPNKARAGSDSDIVSTSKNAPAGKPAEASEARSIGGFDALASLASKADAPKKSDQVAKPDQKSQPAKASAPKP
jgi:hypothetical protein